MRPQWGGIPACGKPSPLVQDRDMSRCDRERNHDGPCATRRWDGSVERSWANVPDGYTATCGECEQPIRDTVTDYHDAMPLEFWNDTRFVAEPDHSTTVLPCGHRGQWTLRVPDHAR